MAHLSKEEGIKIQDNDLKRWGTVLKPQAAVELRELAEKGNAEAESGYDICRGQELDVLIHRHLMPRQFTESGAELIYCPPR